MRSRISRIEAIHGRTLIELAELSEKLQETADSLFFKNYSEYYYENMYDYHRTVGLPNPPASLDAKRVESVLQTAWSGKNYSARIWANRTKLTKEIQRSMMTAIHRGSSIQQLSKDLAQRMEVGYKNAERLIRTELNAVENKASADAMKDAEFTHYQFMATLDRRTCIRCGERDGEIFALKDMNQGENAPPLHPRCRCTIVATFDTPKSKSRTSQERAARDFGNSPKGKTLEFETVKSSRPNATIETPFGKVNVGNVKGKIVDSEAGGHYKRVPADMTYKEWKAVYIDGELQRRSANQGAFAHLQVPMQLKTVKQVCRKYNVDISGFRIKIEHDEELLRIPYAGLAAPERIGQINLFPGAFRTEKELLRTIIHEGCHVKQFKKYGAVYVQENKFSMERVAERYEDFFYGIIARRARL